MKQIGRYEIVEELGQGAMGAVFKARDPMMDRVVAVKTILASALTGPLAGDYRERFFREARAAGRLAHPGIVTVYDVSEQEGTPFLVMEFIEGRTLEKILESGERFDAERVMDIGQQLAEALDYAHKGGVIHRDIKPANIMMTADGRPKITDFGVAKLTAAQVTTTGQLLGTPAFMAPEQFTGAPIDGRADLFALGVMLYWLATGDRPFTGETLMAMSYKIVHTEPVPPRKINPAIPRDLENVILKCMEKDPAERYQSGETLANDLRKLREGRALNTLSRERAARAAAVEKTELSAAAPATPSDAAGDSFDTAETVSVLPPKSRPAAGPATIRATTPMAPRATVAAPPATVSEPPAAKSGRTSTVTWMVFAAVVLIIVFAGQALKRRNANLNEPPQQQAQQQAPAPPAAGNVTSVQVPAPPPAVGVPPEVQKSIADAGKAAEAAKKESARVNAAKQPAGMKLEFTATERAMVVLTPDAQSPATHQLSPGNSVTASAEKEMKLFTDNPAAIRWSMNGRPQQPLGTGKMPTTVRITEAGVETLWSGSPDELSKRLGKPFGPGKRPEGTPTPEELARVKREVQQQLKAGVARLRIETRGVPAGLELVVMMDGKQLLRRAAAAADAAKSRAEEERVVPPGNHQFQVHVGRSGVRVGLTQSVSGEFSAGQRRVLRIQIAHESAGRGERLQNRLSVELQ
ncbi:MAG: protein kinase [Acidobacteria bacterium]|nr:protein kinase [Acidobacteriota bacterium]